MGTRTFLVDGGELTFDANVTLVSKMEAVDQRGISWFKPEFDSPWRLMQDDDKAKSTVEARFKRG